ncbi:ATP-dependent zinc metalloprotease FtsH [Pseudomonadota bacterium]
MKDNRNNNQPPKKKFNAPISGKIFVFWTVAIILMFLISDIIEDQIRSKKEISFSEFLNRVNQQQVEAVNIRGKEIVGQTKNNEYFFVYSVDYPELTQTLVENGVLIKGEPLISKKDRIIGNLLGWAPFLILIGVWYFFMRNMSGVGDGKSAFSFGKSKARLMHLITGRITFNDVAGIDEAKQELTEIVDFLQSPTKYTKIGAKIPRGCLLIGAPGTGKTLLARAIAGEAKVPFFSISGSDFVEMFVGVGASRVRDMFAEGKRNAPCIIFIDEIDAVGRRRGSGIGGGNDEREQTLNQLLVEMDGFIGNEGVIVIAATNRPDVLDIALMRPGRFDRQVVIPVPDINGREAILKVHSKKVNCAPDVNLNIIARGTPGFTGADLANVINEAALISARKDHKVVTMQEIEDAKDRILMGIERKSMVMTEQERKNTAYHEGGHAVVAIHCPSSDPIHKATIIPRGRALGLVMRLPEKDRISITRAKLLDDIAVAMGGRAAEEMMFGYGNLTTGASNDIEVATEMAKNMVTKWGMSDKIGPVYHGKRDDSNPYTFEAASDETLKLIDSEIKEIIQNAEKRAKDILKKFRKDLDLIAESLLVGETLSGDEIKEIIKNKKVIKKRKSTEEEKSKSAKQESIIASLSKSQSPTIESKEKKSEPPKKSVKKKVTKKK